MKRITRENLNKRPAEYVARVLAVATIEEGDIIALSDIDFKAIHEPPLPSLPRMTLNAASAVGAEASARFAHVPPVPDEECARRIAICLACEFFRHDDKRCSKCGCFMEIKSSLRSASCPVGKW